MDLINLIKTRRTKRNFLEKKVPREIVDSIIEAARWAPSAHNMQPWKFIAVENSDFIEKIGIVLENKSKELLSGFNVVLKEAAKQVKKAPLLILVYNTKVISKRMEKFDDPYKSVGRKYEVQSIAASIQNILLFVHSIGLGAAWFGVALFAKNEVNKIMNQSNELEAILVIGYPENKDGFSNKKEISEILDII